MGCSLNKGIAEELIVEYAAGTLDRDARDGFVRHMQSCQRCRELVAQQLALWSALEEWQPPLAASPDFDRKLADRIAHSKRVPWWNLILADRAWRPLISVAAACALLAFAFLLKNDGPARPPRDNPPTPGIELQVEHALDDMDLLKEIGVDVASQPPGAPQKI